MADGGGDDGTASLALFEAVREAQAAPHHAGRSCREAFTGGRCHAFALALRDAAAGSGGGVPAMVALTPPGDPTHLVHVGVLLDGRVLDADGSIPAPYWRSRWEHAFMDFDLVMRPVGEADLHAMMAHRPASADEVAAARLLAGAVLAARSTDPRLWLLARPPVASIGLLDEGCVDEPAPALHDEALSRDLSALTACVERGAAAREARASRGVTVFDEMHAQDLSSQEVPVAAPRPLRRVRGAAAIVARKAASAARREGGRSL